MNKARKIGLLAFVCLSIGFVQSCKNKEPSAIKIFVRSASNELVVGASVVIIGDVNSNPPTNVYVDTILTNESGFAVFEMKAYYDAAGESNTVGYFDIIAKKGTKVTDGRIRSRAHTTAVETVYLPN
ncbi:MAG: hypothetical protein HRT58_15640 [Crocinitomicaceae bacterium]|nr:hypothetical protein [Flavobacteriales bacterium]NQZ37101.1 hypothetical protein [Crocinitomicaceae bacterium]